MAELIPMQYRLRVAQKEHIAKWLISGMLTVVLAVVLLVYAFIWQRQQSAAHEALQAQYQGKSTLIIKSQELRARRQELAGRMQQVQELMDDKMLLTLLRDIADGFGESDTLDYVSIDARLLPKDKAPADPNSYIVYVHGITANSTTLAELMTRLGHRSTAMNVVLESSTRDPNIESHPMRFQIRCEKASEKGT